MWLASLSWRWERHSSSRLGVVQNVTFKVSLEKHGRMFLLLGKTMISYVFFVYPSFRQPHIIFIVRHEQVFPNCCTKAGSLLVQTCQLSVQNFNSDPLRFVTLPLKGKGTSLKIFLATPEVIKLFPWQRDHAHFWAQYMRRIMNYASWSTFCKVNSWNLSVLSGVLDREMFASDLGPCANQMYFTRTTCRLIQIICAIVFPQMNMFRSGDLVCDSCFMQWCRCHLELCWPSSPCCAKVTKLHSLIHVQKNGRKLPCLRVLVFPENWDQMKVV